MTIYPVEFTAGETQADVARTYNVDPTTIGRLLGDRPFVGQASEARPKTPTATKTN
jgi:hypothetical protein